MVGLAACPFSVAPQVRIQRRFRVRADAGGRRRVAEHAGGRELCGLHLVRHELVQRLALARERALPWRRLAHEGRVHEERAGGARRIWRRHACVAPALRQQAR